MLNRPKTLTVEIDMDKINQRIFQEATAYVATLRHKIKTEQRHPDGDPVRAHVEGDSVVFETSDELVAFVGALLKHGFERGLEVAQESANSAIRKYHMSEADTDEEGRPFGHA